MDNDRWKYSGVYQGVLHWKVKREFTELMFRVTIEGLSWQFGG